MYERPSPEDLQAIADFLSRYGDSEEFLCTTCLAEFRRDVSDFCPECGDPLRPAAEAVSVLQQILSKQGSLQENDIEDVDGLSCSCDDDDDETDDGEPLSDEERARIIAFLEKEDPGEGLACIDCLVFHEGGLPACPTCGNGLLTIGEGKVALAHVLQSDAAGAPPQALAFLPPEGAGLLDGSGEGDGDEDGDELDEDGLDDELAAADAETSQRLAAERERTERALAVKTFLQRYAERDIDVDICVHCLEEFRIGIGECPQCDRTLLPGEQARQELEGELKGR